jgi:hypothetical protein
MSICLRRREFIAGLGGAAALPLALEFQLLEVLDSARSSSINSSIAEFDAFARTLVLLIQPGLWAGLRGATARYYLSETVKERKLAHV